MGEQKQKNRLPTPWIEVTDGASIPDPSDKRLVTAWSLALFLALFVLGVVVFARPEPYWDILNFLRDGVIVTFKLTFLGIVMTLPLGLLTGLGRLSNVRIVNLIASFYVEVVRGIPLIVQLCFIYYGLGRFINLPDLFAAALAMSLCYGAYMGEVFRAGISAIDKGQTEAARSLGFNRLQTMWLVVLPLAWPTILPPVGNESIALLKDTALVSILAMTSILQRGKEYVTSHMSPFEAYAMVALLYLIITLLLSKGVSIMEAKLNYYDSDN